MSSQQLYNFSITQNERNYLRELGKKYLEYANLPINEERKKLWYAHNSLNSDRPLIVMEQETFQEELLYDRKCKSKAAAEIEGYLLNDIRNFELIGDDKVISPYYSVFWKIDSPTYGVEIKVEHATDTLGKIAGYRELHPITDLKEDFSKLKSSTFKVDRAYTLAWKNFVEEIIGDILPVKIKNSSLFWYISPSRKVVSLMGLEAMMYSMSDYPERMHALYNFLKEDMQAFIRWQEKEGLLVLNNENDYTGSGSYGFTTELPSTQCKETGVITSKDRWGYMGSEETLGISPTMFGEFIYPYYYELAKNFGLLYYGCCEPVHPIWDNYISRLPGLRKVSISAFCNEEFMGNALRDSRVIYSRKPSPNFVGVEGMFDETAFTEHIAKTLNAAKNCKLEFIFRDVYTLSGDISKPGRAVKITRELIEKMW